MRPSRAPRQVRAEGVTVRAAQASDGPALRLLWRELDRVHGELQPGFFRAAPLPRPPGELVARLADPSQALLVAERGGAVVGAVRVQVLAGPRNGWARPRPRGYLDDLIVAADERRAGVGQALVRAAIEACRARGAEQVVLTVWEGNAAADRVYRRLGFRPANRVLALDLDASAAG